MLAAPRPYVLRLLVLTGNDEVFRVQASVAAAVAALAGRRRRYPLAAACGACCTPWEGSAIVYGYQMIAAGAAAVPAGSLRGRVRG